MATVTDTAAKTAKEYVEPILAAIDDNVRDVRRAVVSARHVVEDRAAQTKIQIRRHPFAALGIAASVGALLGCAIGFTLGRRPGNEMPR